METWPVLEARKFSDIAHGSIIIAPVGSAPKYCLKAFRRRDDEDADCLVDLGPFGEGDEPWPTFYDLGFENPNVIDATASFVLLPSTDPLDTAFRDDTARDTTGSIVIVGDRVFLKVMPVTKDPKIRPAYLDVSSGELLGQAPNEPAVLIRRWRLVARTLQDTAPLLEFPGSQ